MIPKKDPEIRVEVTLVNDKLENDTDDKPNESGELTKSGEDESSHVNNGETAGGVVDIPGHDTGNDDENALDAFIKDEFGGDDDAFLTSVPQIDDAGRGDGVGKRQRTKEDEDLGIYEDTDVDGDDLSDNELEIERLREEKRQRDEKEREEREKQEAEAARAVRIEKLKEEESQRLKEQLMREAELLEKERILRELRYQAQKSEVTPTSEGSNTSDLSARSWTDPRFIQGISLRELVWKSKLSNDPVMTSMAFQIEKSINASRMAMESREAMFRRAMSLLSDRCASMRQGPEGDTQFTFGGHLPKYFYVTQDRPVPMEPLKAWRGYNGNIYFEPININPLKNDIDSDRPQPAVPRTTDNTRVRNVSSKPRNAGQENRAGVDSRSESRQTTKSSVASRHSSNRQMAHLDKQTVLNRYNDSIQEDIVWLEGQESTGSLAVRPKTYPDRKSRDKDRDLQYNKERIHKGSVAHRLFVENKSKQKPRLAVSGGKFTPPNSLSPLLRTQTQYSLSSNRLTTNSPDPYHLNEQKLPPLDQIRATVKPREANGNAQAAPTAPPPKPKIPYLRAVTITDDMKPFVKYSPDVVAKLSQQANIC